MIIDNLSSVILQWTNFCKALYVEAKWYRMGYIPSLQEYLSNAWISSSGPIIILCSYFAIMYEVNDEIDDFLHTYEDLVYNISLVIRLCNDLGTTVVILLPQILLLNIFFNFPLFIEY